MTHRLLSALHDLGIDTPNTSGFPIMEIPLVDARRDRRGGALPVRPGHYATMAAYPLVPKDEVGFRVQVTAANTDEQVDELIEVLATARAVPAGAQRRGQPRGELGPVPQQPLHRGVRQPLQPPPSTRMSVPVTYTLSSPARKR